MELFAYSSPLNLGHKALQGFWDGEIVATEKIDGSQFTFGILNNELCCRSRRVKINQDDPGMFSKAVATARDIAEQGLLDDGVSYRCEYLRNPKHNTLAYDRIPRGNLILFDADLGMQDYVSYEGLEEAGLRLDLEIVPLLGIYTEKPSLEELQGLLKGESILGGAREGIVLKNYEMFGRDSKVVMAKLVSDDFKERHGADWKKRNPGRKDFIQDMIEGLATEARWMKAVQHLREEDMIEGIPQDIPEIMAAIVEDVENELGSEIQSALYHHFWPQIKRGVNKGAAEWYKELLAKEAME